MTPSNEVDIQRSYYAKTAQEYNERHVNEKDIEHYVALAALYGWLDYLNIQSILDVGSGTGRAVAYLKERCPHIKITGVEPVAELREIGHQNGIPATDLIAGDALDLQFATGSFDLVCAFGVLHHVKTPDKAIAEMLRVARKAVFISDSNNFGQGSAVARLTKQLIDSVGLWSTVDWIKTKGKGYRISDGDGLAYSYSVFNDYKMIQKECQTIHLVNTKGSGVNPYRTATHVALLGIKK